MKNIYNIENLIFTHNSVEIIKGITCKVTSEKITFIKGPNGAGKSTFLKLLFGLLIPTSGKIISNFPESFEKSIAFQNPVFLNRSVEENLKHILYCKTMNKSTWDILINSHLEKYNLMHLKNKMIDELSGGELQLISLLRSILIKPDILFYDEPSNNLDDYHLDFIIDIINELRLKNTYIIIVSHDDTLATKIDHDEIILDKGKIKCTN